MPKNNRNSKKNNGAAQKTYTPSHKELLDLIRKVRNEFPAYGFLKVHHKLGQEQPKWIIGKERVRSLMQEEGMMIGHEARRFKLVLVGKKGRKGASGGRNAPSERDEEVSQQEQEQEDEIIPAAPLDEESEKRDTPQSITTPKKSTPAPVHKPKESLSSLQGLPSLLSPSSAFRYAETNDDTDSNDDELNDNVQYRLELINDDEEDMLNNWDDIPTEFLCDITGQLMHEPIITPEGQHFDRKTIELWMNQAGQVNPITQSILLRKDLKVDTELQKRILQWTLEQDEGDDSSEDGDHGVQPDENLYDFS